jgi:hypothetical protein
MGLSRAVHTNHAKKAAERARGEQAKAEAASFTVSKNDAYRSRTGEGGETAQERKEKRRAKQAEEVKRRKQKAIAAKKARQVANRIRKKQALAKPPQQQKKKSFAHLVTACCSAARLHLCATKSERVATFERQQSADLEIVVTQVQRVVRGRTSRQLLAEAEKSLDEYNQQHHAALKELEEERLENEKKLIESHIKKVDSMTEVHKTEVAKRMEILEQLRLARSGSLSPERFDAIDRLDNEAN